MNAMVSPPSSSAKNSNRVSMTVWIAAILIAFLAAWAGGTWTGAFKPQVLLDPGALTRYGSILFKAVHIFALAATAGLLFFGAFLLPEGKGTKRRLTAATYAMLSALIAFITGVLGAVMNFSLLAGLSIGTPNFMQLAWTSTWQLEVLRGPAITTLFTLAIAGFAFWYPTKVGMAWQFAATMAALWPLALVGHAAGSLDHDTAVNGLALHLIGALLWGGGLIALGVLWPRLGVATVRVVTRYSTLALWAFILTGLSGVLSATVRVNSFADLFSTAYGNLLLLKICTFLIMGAFGATQRAKVISVLQKQPSNKPAAKLFWRLALIELVIMAATFGIASAMARSQPPTPEIIVETDPGYIATGYSTPPPFNWENFLSAWRTEWLYTSVAVLAIFIYTRWVLRLRKRGDAWPIHRTIVWWIAWLWFAWTINAGLGVYGHFMFSVHMAEHMTIAMAIPILFVLAAPITLALRALPKRRDNTMGPREFLVSTTHSAYVNFLVNPIFASAFFFFSMVLFYFSPLFELALRTHTGHVLMVVHFLLSGYLFAWSLVGIDPGPKKWSPPMRLLILLVTIAFHAFFGVAMMMGTTLLAGDFFTQVNLPWVPDLLREQQAAGTITWGTGEFPTLLLALIVAWQWLKSDEREASRIDRKAQRDDDAELKAYNERLAAISAYDRQHPDE